MQIENNVAKTEREQGDYRIVITIEHLHAQTITQKEAEIELTGALPFMFTQRRRY